MLRSPTAFARQRRQSCMHIVRACVRVRVLVARAFSFRQRQLFAPSTLFGALQSRRDKFHRRWEKLCREHGDLFRLHMLCGAWALSAAESRARACVSEHSHKMPNSTWQFSATPGAGAGAKTKDTHAHTRARARDNIYCFRCMRTRMSCVRAHVSKTKINFESRTRGAGAPSESLSLSRDAHGNQHRRTQPEHNRRLRPDKYTRTPTLRHTSTCARVRTPSCSTRATRVHV